MPTHPLKRKVPRWALEVAKAAVKDGRYRPSARKAMDFLLGASAGDPELAEDLGEALFRSLKPDDFDARSTQDGDEDFDVYRCRPDRRLIDDFGLAGQWAGDWYVKFSLREDEQTGEFVFLISMHPAVRAMTTEAERRRGRSGR